MPGILHHTRDMYFLADGDMAVLTPDGVELTDFDGNPIDAPGQRIHWDPIQAEKGGYKHFMLKEIFEQPRADARHHAGPHSLGHRQGIPG